MLPIRDCAEVQKITYLVYRLRDRRANTTGGPKSGWPIRISYFNRATPARGLETTGLL